MGEAQDPAAVNAAAADYVRKLRERLADGKQEIDRQKTVVSETRNHLDEVARWRAETDRLLDHEPDEGTAA